MTTPSTSINDFSQLMLQFAQSGFKIFPYLKRFAIGDNVKGVPTNANGTNDEKTNKWSASSDLNKVLSWIQEEDIIGFGITSKTCFIIDIDCGIGKAKADKAMESFQTMKEKLNLPKPSITVQSPSGGYHLYYKKPDFDTKSCTNSKVFAGIDFPWHVTGPSYAGEWAKGTYALTGGRVDNELAPLSETFLKWLEEAHGKVEFKDATAGLVLSSDMVDTFDGSIPTVISSGERHYTILRLIGSWVRQGITRANTIVLIQEALKRCEGEGPKTLSDYIEELDNTLGKSTFNRPVPEPLKFFLDNMVYVKGEDGVYELPSRRFYNKGLRNVYAQHRWFIDPKESNPNSKAAIKEVYAYDQWIKDKDRISVEAVGYKPVKDKIFFGKHSGECVNLYQPPVIQSPDEESDIWDIFVKLVKVLDPNKWSLLIEWAACQVQIPYDKLQIAVGIISEKRGVGKNLFLYVISDCIGKPNFIEVNSVEELFGNHVEFPIKNHLVVINEASTQLSDRYGQKSIERYMERTKDIISKKHFNVNIKYLRTSNVDFYTNFAFTSNNLHALPMEENDRRFEIFMSDNEMLTPQEYGRLWNMTAGEISLIHGKLSEIELVTINAEYTATKVDRNKQMVIEASRSYVEVDLVDAIKNKISVFQKDIVTFELFAWFVLENSGKVSRGYCKDLFKKYCKPVYRKNSNRPRDPKVEIPHLEFKGDDISYKSFKPRYIYSVRNNIYYNKKGRDESVLFYKEQYDTNYAATVPGYIEPSTTFVDELLEKATKNE
jgi:hypothetical protein